MPRRRIIYKNWIVDIGLDPACLKQTQRASPKMEYNQKIIKEVRAAAEKLSPKEKEFIERYYFRGESYRDISNYFNKKINRLENIHRRAITRLKRLLADFVKDEFGIKVKKTFICPICLSPYRDNIDALIRQKKKSDTWKKIIKTAKTEFNIEIRTPQILISHQKYHMD